MTAGPSQFGSGHLREPNVRLCEVSLQPVPSADRDQVGEM